MDLAFVAHTDRCALLLDPDGVCRWVLRKSDADDKTLAAAERCIGAQFVATLDPSVEGLLGHQPTEGKSILFARIEKGRASLVRFGPLTRFESLDAVPKAPSTERVIEADDGVGDDDLAAAAEGAEAQDPRAEPEDRDAREDREDEVTEEHDDARAAYDDYVRQSAAAAAPEPANAPTTDDVDDDAAATKQREELASDIAAELTRERDGVPVDPALEPAIERALERASARALERASAPGAVVLADDDDDIEDRLLDGLEMPSPTPEAPAASEDLAIAMRVTPPAPAPTPRVRVPSAHRSEPRAPKAAASASSLPKAPPSLPRSPASVPRAPISSAPVTRVGPFGTAVEPADAIEPAPVTVVAPPTPIDLAAVSELPSLPSLPSIMVAELSDADETTEMDGATARFARERVTLDDDRDPQDPPSAPRRPSGIRVIAPRRGILPPRTNVR